MEVFQIRGTDSFSVRAVGTSNYQNYLEDLAGGKKEDSAYLPVEVILIEENDNPHDDNAVKVEVNGLKVGYLSRNNAVRYRSLLRGFKREGARVSCRGIIVGGWSREGDSGDYGLRIDFPQIL